MLTGNYRGEQVSYHAKQAIFALQVDGDAGRDVVGGQSGDSNAQVAVHSVLELQSGTANDSLATNLSIILGLIRSRAGSLVQSQFLNVSQMYVHISNYVQQQKNYRSRIKSGQGGDEFTSMRFSNFSHLMMRWTGRWI
jgi:hypothetical protein